MQRACGFKHFEKLNFDSNSWHTVLSIYQMYIIYTYTQTYPHSGIVLEYQRSNIYSKETNEKINSYKLVFKIRMIHFLKQHKYDKN